jgi:hypothetical protein
MSVKKTKGKGKTAAKRPVGEKSTGKKKKGKDIVEVRGNIDDLVKASAVKIATEVIKVALTGQLATARYLFEAIGLYPATEQTLPPPTVGSLAHTLLKRMGLPTEPVICDEDQDAAVVKSDVKAAKVETTTPSAENGLGAGHEDEPEPGSTDGGEQGL